MEATELARWTRFAAKGGIGKATATGDCVAEAADELMFLKNDEIVVLLQLTDDTFLGFCEGIVGKFRASEVRFHAKLKKPVMTKRSSVASSSGGKHTPTPSIMSSSAPSPLPPPSPNGKSEFITSRYPTEPLPPSASFSSTTPSFSHSVSTSSFSSDATVHGSPEPLTRAKVLEATTSTASIDTNVSGRSSTYLAHDEGDGSPKRRSETVAVEMWPTSPSAALTRKPVNGSRLATAMRVVESESESEDTSPEHEHRTYSDEEQDSPLDGGWANVPETLPLQVVKLNSPASSIPPSPYQPMFAPPRLTPSVLSTPQADEDSRSHLDLGSASSESEYDSSDAEGQEDATTKFPVPPDRRSLSPASPRVNGHHEETPTRLSTVAPSFQGSEDGETGIGLSLLQGDDDSDDDEELVPPVRARDQSRMSVGSSARSFKIHGEEWDGASIYENYYRFSRFSTNPRSSGSTMASTSDLRHEYEEHRPSVEKRRSVDSDSDGSVYTQASKTSSVGKAPAPPTEPATLAVAKHRPASLDLVSNNGEPISLLHTRWGSPNSSTTPPSSSAAQTFFELSPGSSGGNLSPGGAASALRQRLELDRGSPAGSNYASDPEPREADEEQHNGIVIEDDEEPPPASITNGPISSSPDEELEDEDMDLETVEHADTKPQLPLLNTDPPPFAGAAAAPGPASASNSPHSPLSSATTTPHSPSSPPDLSPPPAQQPSAVNHHQPRPSLSELRGYMQGDNTNGVLSADAPPSRTSLFLPHPNAPKPPPPTSAPEGPMYIRAPPPPSEQQHGESVINIIRMSIGRSAVTRVMPTIYGRVDGDLASATGPVRVTFTIDPPPPVPSRIPFRNGVPSPAPAPVASPPKRIPPPSVPTTEPDQPKPIPGPASAPSPRTPVRAPSLGPPASAVPTKSSPLAAASSTNEAKSGPIQRPNFFPKVGGSRPRSRSFSGFNTSQISAPMPIVTKDDLDKTQKPSRSMSTIAAPISPPSQQQASPTPPALGKHASRSSLRSAHAPSPLSLPHNNSILGVRGGLRSPTSPLAQTPSSPTTNRPHQLRQMVSHSAINEASHATRPSFSRAPTDSPVHTRNESLLSLSQQEANRPSMENGAAGSRDAVRTKLSLPNLRRNQSRASTDSASPQDTVQIENMDFELIRPNRAMFDQGSARTSEDSSVGRDASVDGRSSAMADARRTDSPAFSVASGSAPWSSSASDNQGAVDAHRQRELKWVSLMGTVPASQAKKSKKVKKLLMEGNVPSSVRFLVWSHLTDGKGKKIPGVYAQLSKRARVPAIAVIERDVQRCFNNHPHMHSSQSSLVTLLSAYLTMVPDVQYSWGLTLIAGHLLALSPEEDAFWIFVSVMDSYLRPYFSSSTTQLEVDAALFSRALESSDPQLGKRILMELGINPVDLCRPWFSTMFCDALPLDYLNRVWDLFLFEGIPFLFRVSLVLLQCCRRPLEARNPDVLFDLIAQPPSSAVASLSRCPYHTGLGRKIKGRRRAQAAGTPTGPARGAGQAPDAGAAC
ncbi:Rab-GAP TBC domain-containing protein [Mycena chlorophos]|uniref:Rab-GAP TBC domain-containing protein n=1 Tax=Mycena chlorophos TaxID=658473 RepID=A0A8H6TQ86_MYCCL|nr:Rab-GAP TBC domain-containing protein [Mycena chlorophos]